jgi:hypothetical protein
MRRPDFDKNALTEVDQVMTNQADLTEIRLTLNQVVRVKG